MKMNHTSSMQGIKKINKEKAIVNIKITQLAYNLNKYTGLFLIGSSRLINQCSIHNE